jgi:hypothetical protein
MKDLAHPFSFVKLRVLCGDDLSMHDHSGRKLISEKAAVDAIIFVRPTSEIPHRGRVAQLAEQLTLNQ